MARSRCIDRATDLARRFEPARRRFSGKRFCRPAAAQRADRGGQYRRSGPRGDPAGRAGLCLRRRGDRADRRISRYRPRRLVPIAGRNQSPAGRGERLDRHDTGGGATGRKHRARSGDRRPLRDHGGLPRPLCEARDADWRGSTSPARAAFRGLPTIPEKAVLDRFRRVRADAGRQDLFRRARFRSEAGEGGPHALRQRHGGLGGYCRGQGRDGLRRQSGRGGNPLRPAR